MPDLFLELPLPPSVNGLYPTSGNRRVLSKEGKAWYEKAIYAIRNQTQGKMSFPHQRVKLTIWFTFANDLRRDISNYVKITEDSMKKAGVWTDDCQVDHLEVIRMPPSKEHAGAKVMISPLPIGVAEQ